MRDLTTEEERVVTLLGEAWDAYDGLPEVHPDDGPEFSAHVHSAQNVVLARPRTQEYAEADRSPAEVLARKFWRLRTVESSLPDWEDLTQAERDSKVEHAQSFIDTELSG